MVVRSATIAIAQDAPLMVSAAARADGNLLDAGLPPFAADSGIKPSASVQPISSAHPISKTWAERRRGSIGFAILAPFALVAALSAPAPLRHTWGDVQIHMLAWTMFMVGAFFRMWATLYIGGRKGRTLVCEGPYSITRNPLYFGTLLMAVAVALFLRSWTLSAGLALASTAYLFVTIPSEERRLRGKLGAEYAQYCRRVPRLIPRLSTFRADATMALDLRCLGVECRRALRWIWIPVLAEILLRAHSEAWWPRLFNAP
jgi:protein-S-isoprenylcysteine O-methyltransferase Ste14